MSENSKSNAKTTSKLVKPSVGIPKPATKQSLNSTSSTSIASNLAKSISTANLNPDEPKENLEDFKINERVWVNGTKAGCIAFIGETNFKEGIWAGIILDTNDGKNNGTVNNVTYFKTEENRGVFCRLNKLTKAPTDIGLSTGYQSERADGLKIGCRVMIVNSDGSTKCGLLRFIGETEFAKGEWAGIELDEKLGKNDGSVANKRYFQCEPLFGVFAPSHKVQLETPNELKAASKAIVSSTPKSGAKLSGLTKKHSESQESIISEKSSIISAASAMNKSSIQRKPVPKQIQITSNAALINSKKPVAISNNNVIQQSLKEKESYIAQLLKERDFERAEFTRAAQKFEETETRLTEYIKLIEEKNDEIVRLNQKIGQLDEKKETLLAQSQIDKTKIEDLEFQIEEQKLGCVDSEEKCETKQWVVSTKDEENILLKQLEFQKELVKNNKEEIKFLKEEIERLNVQNKTLLLAEEVHTKENNDLGRKVVEMDQKLAQSMVDSQEFSKIKEKLTQKEKEFVDKAKIDETKINSLSSQLTDLKIKIESLENERSDLEFVYEESKVKISDLLKRIEQIKLEQIDNSNHGDIEFALEEHKVMVQEMETKLKNLEKEKEELEKNSKIQIESLNEQMQRLNADKSEIVNENSNLKSQIEQKNKEILELNADSSSLKEINEKLKERETLILDLNKNIENLKNEKTQQDEILAKVRQEYDQALIEAKNSNKDDSNKMDELVTQNQLLSSNIQALKEKLNSNEIKLEESKNSNIELQSRLSEMIKNSGDNSTQLTILNEKIKEKDDQIEQLRNNLTNKQQEANSLKDENDSKQKQLNEISDQIKGLNEKMCEKDSLIQEANSKSCSIEMELEILRNEKSNIEKAKDEISAQISQYQTQLEESRKKFEEHQQKIDLERKEMSEKILNLENLVSQKDDLVKEMEPKIRIFENEKETLTKELEQLKEINQNLISSQKNTEQSAVEQDKLKAELETLKKNEEILQKNVAERNEKIEEQQKEIKEFKFILEEKDTKFTNEKSNLLTQMNTLIKEKQDLEIEKDTLRSQNEQVQNKLDKLNMDLENSQNGSTSVELINELNGEIETLSGKLKKQESKENQLKDDYETTIKNLKDIIKETFEQNEKLSSQMSDLRSEFELYETEIKNNKELIEYHESENSHLKHELEILREKNQTKDSDKEIKNTLVSELKPAPVLYSDNLDIFDLHSTEESPHQSIAQNPTSPDPTPLVPHSKDNFDEESNLLCFDELNMLCHDDSSCLNQETNFTYEQS